MSQPDSETIRKAVEARLPAFLEDLKTLVSIDSNTGNMEGSRKIAALLKPRIEAAGGCYEERVSPQPGGVHVIARFAGQGRKTCALIVHTDTVFNTRGGAFPYHYDPATGLAHGPGVGDCKASAVMALHLAEVFHQLGHKPFKELIVYFDAEEEHFGSRVEHDTAVELAEASDYVLLADTGRPNFGVVTRRKTTGTYTFTVTGHGGHAGNAPHASGNALLEACRLATRVASLGSPLPEEPWNYTSAALAGKGIQDTGQFIPDNALNVAVLRCDNDKSNVIPDRAVLTVNLRCYEQKEHERIVDAMRALAEQPETPWTAVAFAGSQAARPMELTPEARAMVDVYADIARRECGRDIVEWTAGGVTLANVTAQIAPTMDSVGVDTDPLVEHSEREFIDPGLFVPRAIVMYHFIKEFDS